MQRKDNPFVSQWISAKWKLVASIWKCLASKSVQIALLSAKKWQTFQSTMNFDSVAVLGGSLAAIGGLFYLMKQLH